MPQSASPGSRPAGSHGLEWATPRAASPEREASGIFADLVSAAGDERRGRPSDSQAGVSGRNDASRRPASDAGSRARDAHPAAPPEDVRPSPRGEDAPAASASKSAEAEGVAPNEPDNQPSETTRKSTATAEETNGEGCEALPLALTPPVLPHLFAPVLASAPAAATAATGTEAEGTAAIAPLATVAVGASVAPAPVAGIAGLSAPAQAPDATRETQATPQPGADSVGKSTGQLAPAGSETPSGDQHADSGASSGDSNGDAQGQGPHQAAHRPHGLTVPDAAPKIDPSLSPAGPQPANATPPGVAPLNAALAANAPIVAAPSSAPGTEAAGVPIEGLAVAISAKASEGIRRFDIRLDPAELGRIDVRLDVGRDGQVTSRLVVERAETLDLLRRDAHTLEQALQSAGLRTDGGAMQFSLRQQHSGHDESSGAVPSVLIVPDDDVAVREAVRRGYGALRGLGRGVDIRI